MDSRVGLQLYTLRDYAAKDFVGMLKEVAAIGYEGVEFAGYGGLDAKELKGIMSGLGMTAASAHVTLADLQKDDAPLEYALELGLTYVVCPYLTDDLRTSMGDYLRLAETLNRVGERYSASGLQLCYHNHDFEFDYRDSSGRFALDVLLESTKDHVASELDVYWIERAGQSALDYMKRYAGRCPVLHLKDMADDDMWSFAALGEGILNLPLFIETAEQSGTQWLFVEQDRCSGNPIDSVKTSFAYLKSYRENHRLHTT